MINVGLYYRVKRGKEREFEEIFTKVVETLKDAGLGFIDGKLYRQVQDPQEYLIYSEWRDLDSFRNFMQSRAFKDTTEVGKTVLEGRPYHKVFAPVE